MAKVVDLIETNLSLIKTFVSIGKMPLSLMNDYEIYLFYKGIDKDKKPMQKYKCVSLKFKISVSTVRRAVKEMNKTL